MLTGAMEHNILPEESVEGLWPHWFSLMPTRAVHWSDCTLNSYFSI